MPHHQLPLMVVSIHIFFQYFVSLFLSVWCSEGLKDVEMAYFLIQTLCSPLPSKDHSSSFLTAVCFSPVPVMPSSPVPGSGSSSSLLPFSSFPTSSSSSAKQKSAFAPVLRPQGSPSPVCPSSAANSFRGNIHTLCHVINCTKTPLHIVNIHTRTHAHLDNPHSHTQHKITNTCCT